MNGETYIKRRFVILILRQILFWRTNQEEREGHEREMTEMYTGFWWGKPKTRDPLEDLGVDGRIASKCIIIGLINCRTQLPGG